MVRISWAIFTLLLFALQAKAQTNRYMVFLSDKDNSSYSTSSPEAFLSDKAIERRSNQTIAVTLQDLPVNENYIQEIKGLGVDVFYTSKWMNGALIQTDQSNIPSVEALSFVDSIIYVAPGSRLSFGARRADVEEQQKTEATNKEQLEILGINTLQDQGYFGNGVSIAFFDGGFTGVNTAEAFQHMYNDNRLQYQYNFVEHSGEVYKASSHGTQVFSTVSGFIEGQYQGVATKATYMLCLTEDEPTEYRIEEYNWLIAAEKADSAGVDIISSSLGYDVFDDPAMDYSFDKLNGQTAIITQAANIAFEKGILLVVSVGNEGNSTAGTGEWEEITAPADAFNIISVGSIDSDGSRSSFSSRGPTADSRIKPEVVAYGKGASVISSNGTITANSGTSFAAPQIAGLAALLWEANPALTNIELRDMLLNLGSNVENLNNELGYGIPNYNSILGVDDQLTNNQLKVYPNPVTQGQLKISGEPGQFMLHIFNNKGQLLHQQQIILEDLKGGFTVDVSALPKGLYHLEALNKTKRLTARFVKF